MGLRVAASNVSDAMLVDAMLSAIDSRGYEDKPESTRGSYERSEL